MERILAATDKAGIREQSLINDVVDAAESTKSAPQVPADQAVGDLLDAAAKSKLDVSSVSDSQGRAANAVRLRTHLKFMEDGILDNTGQLTQKAVEESKMLIKGADLNNLAVIAELTKDGSNIADWAKFTTKAVSTNNGQKLQVHYYRNSITSGVNYSIDFKVNQVVQP